MSGFSVHSKFSATILKAYVLDNIKRAEIKNVTEVKEVGMTSIQVETSGEFISSAKLRAFKTYMVAAFGNEVTVNEL